jgi:TonB family protein
MKTLDWVTEDRSTHPILIKSAGVSFLILTLILIGMGIQNHWLVHPTAQKGLDESRFIEAEMVQIPEEARLVEQNKPAAEVSKPETTLSKVPGQGKPTPEGKTQLEEENRTESGPPPVARNHGPVAVYSPPPVIPTYLQNQEFKTHVVIDFYVTSEGASSPRLVGTSGNEELDAIALSAAKKWQFRPAEQEGKPIDSKVRLRIVFEVK